MLEMWVYVSWEVEKACGLRECHHKIFLCYTISFAEVIKDLDNCNQKKQKQKKKYNTWLPKNPLKIHFFQIYKFHINLLNQVMI